MSEKKTKQIRKVEKKMSMAADVLLSVYTAIFAAMDEHKPSSEYDWLPKTIKTKYGIFHLKDNYPVVKNYGTDPADLTYEYEINYSDDDKNIIPITFTKEGWEEYVRGKRYEIYS